jgi:hypothetical protein
MKIAFTRIIDNINVEPTNPIGLEVFYYTSKLTSEGHNVYYVGNKGRVNKNNNNFINYTNTDFSEFDEVYIQLTRPNFFGGRMKNHTLKCILDLSNFKGKVNILVTDPQILIFNYAQVIKDRFKTTNIQDNDIDNWNKIIENATYIFPGKDINKFFGWTPKNVVYFDFFKEIFKLQYNSYTHVDNNIDKKYDLVYYGSNRSGERNKLIKNFFKSKTNNVLVGSDKIDPNIKCLKKMKHTEILDFLNTQTKVSLVIGDKAHLNNVVTFRLYETMMTNSLAAIHIDYDPNKEIITDPELREILYVSGPDDIEKLVNMYSKELVDKQHRELKKILYGT